MIDAACAKARVTIAKAIPPTRKAIAPTTEPGAGRPDEGDDGGRRSGSDHVVMVVVRK